MIDKLPDNVLVKILKLLNSYEVMMVSKVSPKVNSMRLAVKALWTFADFSGYPLNLEDMEDIPDYLHCSTVSLILDGFLEKSHFKKDQLPPSEPRNELEDSQCNITGPFMKRLANQCRKLEGLEILNAWLPFQKIKFEEFPSSLTHLTLIKCQIYGAFFEDINTILPLLKFLHVETPINFLPTDIQYFKRHDRLQTLALRQCGKGIYLPSNGGLPDGFPNLRTLDLTLSYLHPHPYGDHQLNVLSKFETLKDLTLTHDLRPGFHLLIWAHDGQGVLRHNLEYLSFILCSLTDIILNEFAFEFNKLKQVHLIKCRGISDVGVTNFIQIIKARDNSCKIVYEK